MCEVVVLCERTTRARSLTDIPTTGAFNLYHFETRTFWSQIASIGKFLITTFSTDGLAARGHTRPVRMITVADGFWSEAETMEGRLVIGAWQTDRVFQIVSHPLPAIAALSRKLAP